MNTCPAPDPLGRSLASDPFGRSLSCVDTPRLVVTPSDSDPLGRSLALVLSVLAALSAVVQIAGSVWPIAWRSMRPFLDTARARRAERTRSARGPAPRSSPASSSRSWPRATAAATTPV
jgi:hypothetical protein